MSFVLPPVEKLPLAIRKNVRDNFEAEKEGLVSKLSDLLGRSYTVTFDPNELFPYNNSDNFGYMLKAYLEGFIYSMTSYTEKYSTDGVQDFNDAVHTSEIVMHVSPKGDSADPIDCEIVDGVFNILFKHDCFGYNLKSLDSYIDKRISAIPRDDLPLIVKHSIATQYNPEIESVRNEISQALAMPDLVLDPNFTECYEKLKAADPGPNYDDWEYNFGRTIFVYFKDGLLRNVNSLGFSGDEMLQEGLAEALTSTTFQVRVVDELSTSGQNETVIEDGVCYLQTIPTSWYYNVGDMGEKLVDLL